MPLLWVLRDELGIDGPKYGCGMAQCGACTVHVDGAAVRSCSVPVGAVKGPVTTIEGLGRPDALHAVQKAWIDLYKRDPANPLRNDLPDGAVALNPYVRIDASGITLITPRADKGQGAYSVQAALIAEELDVAWGQSMKAALPQPRARWISRRRLSPDTSRTSSNRCVFGFCIERRGRCPSPRRARLTCRGCA